jgi:hypothetical protein
MSAICVLGERRCGTSHAAMLLRTRFDIDMGDEREIGYNFPERLRRSGCLGNWERTTTTTVLQAVMRRLYQKYRIIRVVRELDAIYDGELWGFKHPGFTLHMPALASAFPGMKFVACYRDPRDVAKSVLEAESPENVDNEYLLGIVANNASEQMDLCKKHSEKLFAEGRVMNVHVEDYARLGEEEIVYTMSAFLNRAPGHYPLLPPYEMYKDE